MKKMLFVLMFAVAAFAGCSRQEEENTEVPAVSAPAPTDNAQAPAGDNAPTPPAPSATPEAPPAAVPQ